MKNEKKCDILSVTIEDVSLFKLDTTSPNEERNTKSIEFIYAVWDKVLRRDPQWHFINGYGSIELRFSRKYRDELMRHLSTIEIDGKKPQCSPVSIWVEPWPFTRENQETFALIFHTCSEIAMLMYEKHGTLSYNTIKSIVERTTHIMSNNLNSVYSGSKTFLGFDILECSLLGEILTERAFLVGRHQGIRTNELNRIAKI